MFFRRLKLWSCAALLLCSFEKSASASNLYGLVQTSSFNELLTYDLSKPGSFGYDPNSLLPLNFTNLLPQNSITSIAAKGNTLYGLVRTGSFNELLTYDLSKPGSFGYDPDSLLPLNFTNLLPQNSITSIAVEGNTLYGLVRTGSFNELLTYDLSKPGSFGYDPNSLLPLNFTNLLPQNSITSIAVEGNTLYGLVRTGSFNELLTYDLSKPGSFGYDPNSLLPLNFTNLLPQNSITSIAVEGNTLYGLVRTGSFNELLTYDLSKPGSFGYDPNSLLPLNFTNLLPQNSIVAIAVDADSGTLSSVPLPPSLPMFCFALLLLLAGARLGGVQPMRAVLPRVREIGGSTGF